MAITLYDTTVALFIQTLGAMEGFLKRGLAHCEDNNIATGEVLETRLFADMLPFRYQVQAAIGHSVGAIEGVKGGVFKPPYGTPTSDYAALQAEVADALAKLKAYTPDEINALEGRDVIFNLGDRQMPFTAEGFLLTFSLANFHFHATTAYDILRSKGVPLGKRDYLGRIKLKG
ncbi:MAG: DUF1993 domain-containing protein [Alphaproteobacteria bacterium]|nr:MAG: DUF1993 domain-containing protein [Alphaproteobacteria bacterium]